MVKRDGLQPGKPVAAVGAAAEDRQLVAGEFAATVGEDRRQASQARLVLLAAAGREPSDQAVVWKHGTADRWAGAGDRVAGGP